MVEYKCYDCGKMVDQEHIVRRIRCPHCSSKILIKTRTLIKHLKAR